MFRFIGPCRERCVRLLFWPPWRVRDVGGEKRGGGDARDGGVRYGAVECTLEWKALRCV